MLNFIDISHWQDGINISAVSNNIDAVICKATEGNYFIDNCFEGYINDTVNANKLFGFYHFASDKDPVCEAEFFYRNTLPYFTNGIPVLDWEGEQSVEWVNTFVDKIYAWSGLWCWIYANPWRFNQGGVNENCMRWIAQYPNVAHPTFNDASQWDTPETDGLVGAWQFCSDGRIDGYNNDLDCSIFYGSKDAWLKYTLQEPYDEPTNSQTLENNEYKITIERK